MSTLKQKQKSKFSRKSKRWSICRVKKLRQCPQKKGVCTKVLITHPKKPNSSKRKIVNVSVKRTPCRGYVQGMWGHNLKKFSRVLLRGGRVRDLIGMRLIVIRNKFDLQPVKFRRKARSKYGVKLFRKVYG